MATLTRPRSLVLLVLACFAVLGAIVLYVLLAEDPVQAQYDGMAIGMEDHCNRLTSEADCQAYGACYRQGIEAAFPPDLIAQMLDGAGPEIVPATVETAHTALQASCAAEVGLRTE